MAIPRIVVEQSPWQTFFESLPGMLRSYQQQSFMAEEAEKDRQFKESQLYLKDKLETNRMLRQELRTVTKKNREAGLTTATALDALALSSPMNSTNKSIKKVSSDYNDMLAFEPDALTEALAKAENDAKLLKLGASDARAIDKDFSGLISLNEINLYQKANPELLKSLDMEQLPEAYIQGAIGELGKPEVKQKQKALFDLNAMLAERVTDTDPKTPGLQYDPSDSRAIDIQNTLDMIQLGQVASASASLKKVTGAQDPFAVEPYGKLSSRILESQNYVVKKDPRLGDVVKRIDPATGDTLDVSRQEAAQTIMTQKNINRLREEAEDQLKIMDAGEERVQKDFDAEQEQRYRRLHTFYQSGPLKLDKDTPKWVKKIYDESSVLRSLLARKDWRPGTGGKHQSEGEMKLIQKDIQTYISEIMAEGYKPHADLKAVFNAGVTADQKARNVLNSPVFQQAVNPRGDGTYDEEEASKNLNELFDFHGVSIDFISKKLGAGALNERSLAQGKAVAHLYNVWFGIEEELIRRRGYDLERQDKQRDYTKVIQGL